MNIAEINGEINQWLTTPINPPKLLAIFPKMTDNVRAVGIPHHQERDNVVRIDRDDHPEHDRGDFRGTGAQRRDEFLGMPYRQQDG